MRACGRCSRLRGGIFPRYLTGLDEEFRRQEYLSFSATDAVLDYLDTQHFREADWEEVLQAELLALPGWAGLMRRLEEDPGLAPHETVPCSLMDFLAVRLTMARVASRMGAAETVPQESPLKTQEKRRLSRAARVYDAARVVSLSADEVNRLSDAEWAAFVSEVKACNGLERRRILHLAYERWHEREILRGLASHRQYRGSVRAASAGRRAGVLLHRRARGIHAARARGSRPGGGDLQRRRLLRRCRGLQGNRRRARRGVLSGRGKASARGPGTAQSGGQRVAGEPPLAQADSRTAHAELVRLVADADARLALDHRAGIALGGSPDRPPAGAPALRAAARVAEQGVPSRAAHRTDADAQHRAVARRRGRSVDGIRGRGKDGKSGQRSGSGGPDARLRPPGGDSRARIDAA